MMTYFSITINGTTYEYALYLTPIIQCIFDKVVYIFALDPIKHCIIPDIKISGYYVSLYPLTSIFGFDNLTVFIPLFILCDFFVIFLYVWILPLLNAFDCQPEYNFVLLIIDIINYKIKRAIDIDFKILRVSFLTFDILDIVIVGATC